MCRTELVGREAVIVGSGDIGMIMARRLTLEGVKIKGVVENHAVSCRADEKSCTMPG